MIKNRHLRVLILSIMAISGSFMLNVSKTSELTFIGFPIEIVVCPFKAYTSINCPICGMTRSFAAIGHYKFGDSCHYHRMGILLYLFLLAQIPYRMARLISERDDVSLQRKMLFHPVFTFAVVLLFVNWVVGYLL